MDVLLQHADLVTHSLDLAAGGPVRHVTDVILRLLVEESGERHDGGSLLQTGGEVLPSVIEPRSHGSESHKKKDYGNIELPSSLLTSRVHQRSDLPPLTCWRPSGFLIC